MSITTPHTATLRLANRTDDTPTRFPKGAECGCATCGRIFKSEGPFRAHFIRHGSGRGWATDRCRTDGELEQKGMRFNPRKGHWRVPNPIRAEPAAVPV